MFNRVIGYFSNERDNFNENVKDNFGNSIDSDMFEPIYIDLLKLQETYQSFKIKETEINSLTMELRTII
ncbi:hypothetical protein KST14_01045 [Fusobacterium animalis]|jgi:hypothetical protein|uniref:hypothetical protein n=1 Tax=Fusobacterium animalis TaxID=76859 RepID=UPI0030CB55BC